MKLKFPVQTWNLRDNITQEEEMEVTYQSDDEVNDHSSYLYRDLLDVLRLQKEIEDLVRVPPEQQTTIATASPQPLVPTLRVDDPFIHQGFLPDFDRARFMSLAEKPQPLNTKPPQIPTTPTKPTMNTVTRPFYIEVRVGPPPNLISSLPYFPPFNPQRQQTFHLPAALLRKHSRLFSSTISNPVILPQVDPSIFQDFVSYLTSNIYSPDTRSSDIDPLTRILLAWLLGQQLGAPDFQNAVFAKLYCELEEAVRDKRHPAPPPEPIAKFATDAPTSSEDTDKKDSRSSELMVDSYVPPPPSNPAPAPSAGKKKATKKYTRKDQTDLGGVHINLICTHFPARSHIRRLLFDAAAALFDQEQVFELARLYWSSRPDEKTGKVDVRRIPGYPAEGTGERAWLEAYKHEDFRAALAASVNVKDQFRGLILAKVAEYLPGFGETGPGD
jgi:hypothetical protein